MALSCAATSQVRAFEGHLPFSLPKFLLGHRRFSRIFLPLCRNLTAALKFPRLGESLQPVFTWADGSSRGTDL